MTFVSHMYATRNFEYKGVLKPTNPPTTTCLFITLHSLRWATGTLSKREKERDREREGERGGEREKEIVKGE